MNDPPLYAAREDRGKDAAAAGLNPGKAISPLPASHRQRAPKSRPPSGMYALFGV